MPLTQVTSLLFCKNTQACFSAASGAVNSGSSLRLLKSQCGGSGESRRKARRKLERGLMPSALIPADASRGFGGDTRGTVATSWVSRIQRSCSFPVGANQSPIQFFLFGLSTWLPALGLGWGNLRKDPMRSHQVQWDHPNGAGQKASDGVPPST